MIRVMIGLFGIVFTIFGIWLFIVSQVIAGIIVLVMAGLLVALALSNPQ